MRNEVDPLMLTPSSQFIKEVPETFFQFRIITFQFAARLFTFNKLQAGSNIPSKRAKILQLIPVLG